MATFEHFADAKAFTSLQACHYRRACLEVLRIGRQTAQSTSNSQLVTLIQAISKEDICANSAIFADNPIVFELLPFGTAASFWHSIAPYL